MIGIIEAVETVRQTTAQDTLMASAELNMFRGAIIGALIVGLAFLSGFAVLRRGALAYCTAFMIGTAAALELFWLGFFPVPSANIIVLLQGVFAASVIIFLSASIKLAKNNATLGGLMFAASLVFVGVGIINFLGRADFSAVMIRSLMGVSIFTFLLAAVQSVRGDIGARMILPGSILVLLATGVFATGMFSGLIGHGLLTLGLLAASLVALTEKGEPFQAQSLPGMAVDGLGQNLHSPLQSESHHASARDAQSQGAPQGVMGLETNAQNSTQMAGQFDGADPHSRASQAGGSTKTLPEGRKPVISGERLAEVLDFSGIAVWDWTLDGVYQSDSLCALLGADCEANFTPEAMRAFIMPSHLGLFEKEILGHANGDGGFDAHILMHNNEWMRIRGARAIDNAGRLERVVAFFEKTPDPSALAALTQNAPQDDTSAGFNNGQALTGSAPLFAGVEPWKSDKTNEHAVDEGQKLTLRARPVYGLGTDEIIGFQMQADATASIEWQSEPFVTSLLRQGADFLADIHRHCRENHEGPKVSSDAFVSYALDYADLIDGQAVETVRSAILASGLPYGILVFELSGLTAIDDVSTAKSAFNALRQAGARLAFADTQAGRAVLGNLHRYDFDTIIINNDLTSEFEGKDKEAQNSIRTLLSLGRDLGLRVIAEGVHTEETMHALQKIGCSYGQGDCLGRVIDLAPLVLTTPKAATAGNLDQMNAALSPLSTSPKLSGSKFTGPGPAGSNLIGEAPSEAVSLDQWTGQEAVSPASQANVPLAEREAPIKNIEAAFAESMPTFAPRTEVPASRYDGGAFGGAPAQSRDGHQAPLDNDVSSTSLPKWRTWVKNMR